MVETLRRCVLVVLALAVLFLSGAWLVHDDLRKATKAESAAEHQVHGASVSDAELAHGGAGGGAPTVVAIVARRELPKFPRPTSDARPTWAHVDVVRLTPRARWASLGGHGRLGPG